MASSDKENKPVAVPAHSDSDPYFEWKYELNEKTGKYDLKSIALSDGSQVDQQKLRETLKRTVGTSDKKLGVKMLDKISYGLTGERVDQRLNEASAMLSALKPQDETEAMLLGQFNALQDSGFRCLRYANLPDQGFYHEERLLLLANKLLSTANQTMQTVLKYRSKGQQVVQVVHLHNKGQAIVAQNLSSPERGGAPKQKRELNPLDHCGEMHCEE